MRLRYANPFRLLLQSPLQRTDAFVSSAKQVLFTSPGVVRYTLRHALHVQLVTPRMYCLLILFSIKLPTIRRSHVSFSPSRVLVGWACSRLWLRWPAGGTGKSIPNPVFKGGAVRKVIITRTAIIVCVGGLCLKGSPCAAYSNHTCRQCFVVGLVASESTACLRR